MKQYDIVTNPQNPASDVHSFKDEVQEGIFVVKLKSGKYFIDYSTWVAKTMREYSFGIYRQELLQQDPPIEFVEFFRLGTSQKRNTSPEYRISKQAMLGEFHNAIYVNYAQRYGVEHVISSRWLVYGKKGHEGKTAFIDNLLNHYNYQEILADVDTPKESTLN